MSAFEQLKRSLQPYFDQGLELWLENGALRFKAPKEVLSKSLMTQLKANKPALLEWLQSEAKTDQVDEPELLDEYPLAYTQGAIWMLYRFAPHSPAYNTTFACTLASSINEAAVRQAFHALLIRHPVLRTTFADTDLGPRQRVWSHVAMPLQLVDGSHWDEQALQEYLDQEADAPFDLAHEPCLRVKIVRNSVKGDILIATIQHVGADLWALLIVAQDIKTFYETAAGGEAVSVPPVAATYRQHVEWQQAFMQSEAGQRQRRYWQRQLQGAPITVSLPADYPRPPLLQLQTNVAKQVVATETYEQIKLFCKRNGITPFVFVQAAFQLLVQHHTQANEFLLGTPTMGRSAKGMDQVVGDFANPVVLRAQVDVSASLTTHLTKVKQTLLAALEHQECPFPVVVQDCNPARDSSRTPLFQLMLVWHQGNVESLPRDGFIADILPMSGPRGAPYDVMLAVSDLGHQFELNWTYQTSMYRESTIAAFNHQLQQLFAEMVRAEGSSASIALANILQQVFTAAPVQQPDSDPANEKLQPYDHLQSFDHLVVQQRLNNGQLIKRLFIAATAAEVDQLEATMAAEFDDIYPLTRLPRNQAGAVDRFQLLKLPILARHPLMEKLEPLGVSADQLVVLRDQNPLPAFSAEELDKQPRGAVKEHASVPAATLLSDRAEAWMIGAPMGEESPGHLFEALRHTASRFPDRGILFLADESQESLYRYSQLLEDAHIAAAGLQSAGIQAGDIVLLQMRFEQRFFAIWWGAVLAGVRPLVVATPEQYSERNGVAQKLYNVAHSFAELVVAADTDKVEQTRNWLGVDKRVIDADQLLQPGTGFEFNGYSADPVAFLQLTSGSTGTPKAIQITHKGILHHVAASAQFNQYCRDDVSLNWLPFDHVVPILTTHLKDVVLGVQQIQLPTARVLADPLLWLETVTRYKVTYSWAPNFAYQRVLDALRNATSLPELDLSSVRIMMNAGEQVLAPVVKAFTAALSPFGLHKDAVQPAFGMAEACTCMTYNNNASDQLAVHFRATADASVVDIVAEQDATHGFVDLGAVVPGVEVRITDSDNRLVKEGVIGRMQIRGPVVTPGYLNNPDANAEAFVGDGWFNSGDLGFIWNKRLILTGREKEMIVVNGANFYCFELEQAVTDLAGVVPTFVAATGVQLVEAGNSEALVIFYVSDASQDATLLERQIIARVNESFGIVARYAIEVQADEFYKTTSGKIQRGQFKKQFESGYYQDSVASFKHRHSEQLPCANSAYSLDWTVEPVSGSAETDILQLQRPSDIEPLIEKLKQPRLTSWVIDLGQLTEVEADAGYQLAQQMTWLARAINASGYQNPLRFWSQADNREWVRLLKPLLETLQQEAGNSRLHWTVSQPSSVPVRGGRRMASYGDEKGTVIWQETGYQHQLLLNSIAPAAIFDEPVIRYGVYLVTGGLGGLAEPLCEYLIQQRKARVILSGRVELNGNPQRQARLNQLKARFGDENLHYVRLQNWQQDTLHAQIGNGLCHFATQKLDGAFHLAGQLSMRSLETLDKTHWQEATQAKIEGSLSLARYLRECWPDSIFVQYGSLNSFFGGQNAAAYSFSNAVQCDISNDLNRHTKIRSWCINWSLWQGTGMATGFAQAEIQLARNKGFIPLSENRDSVWIEKILQQPPQNYFIGLDAQQVEIRRQSNLFYRSKQQLDIYIAKPKQSEVDVIRQLIESHVQQPFPSIKNSRVECHLLDDVIPRDDKGTLLENQLRQLVQMRQQQAQPGELPATQTEVDIAAIWSDILGQTVMDVSRSFFEYGGHSINATQVIAAINNKLGLPVTVAQLFQFPTIRDLARVISQGETEPRLSLGLNECLARTDRYRLDWINRDAGSERTLVLLPTALGVPSVYGQMVGQLSDYNVAVISMPFSVDAMNLQQAAGRIIDLLQQFELDTRMTTLVGWSMAGVLGYEILQQLTSRHWSDEKGAPQLIMLDSGFAEGLHEITFDSNFQRLMFAVELGLGMDRYAEFNQHPNHDTKIHWLKHYLETIGIEVDEPVLLEWWNIYESRLQSLLTYNITKLLPRTVNIHLLKASLHTHGQDDLGWGDESKTINWKSIHADHQGIVKCAEASAWIRSLLQ